MTTRKSKKEKRILEVREIFVDASQYNNEELIGYCRLIKSLCKKQKERIEVKIQIAAINEILKQLDERTYDILRRRYWLGWTRCEIGTLMNLSGERVRQIEVAVQGKLKFLLKKGEGSVEIVAIERLNFDSRSYLALKRANINTLQEVVMLSQHDLLSIKGIGVKSTDEIKQKVSDFMMLNAPEKQSEFEMFSIDALNFSYRVNNALKRRGIFTIKQLFALSVDELYSIRGIGEKGVEEIWNEKQEITDKYQ